MGGHSRFLVKEFGLDEETVKRARAGGDVPGLSGKERALVLFARKVTEDPRQVDASDIDALRAAGVDTAEIVEALSMVMCAAFTNTLALTLKFEEDLEAFGMRREYF